MGTVITETAHLRRMLTQHYPQRVRGSSSFNAGDVGT